MPDVKDKEGREANCCKHITESMVSSPRGAFRKSFYIMQNLKSISKDGKILAREKVQKKHLRLGKQGRKGPGAWSCL
jgi:hypothetical protein